MRAFFTRMAFVAVLLAGFVVAPAMVQANSANQSRWQEAPQTLVTKVAGECMRCTDACDTCGYYSNGCSDRCKNKKNPMVLADCRKSVKVFPRC